MTQSSDLERENRALRAAGSDSVPGHPSNGRLRIAMTRAVSSAAFALLLGCAAILAGCGSSGGSAPSASEPEVMATPVPASASAPVAEVRAEPSPSATAPAITAVTAGPSPPAATPAATPAPTRSVTPPAQPTRSPGPTPEATLPAVKTAAQTTAAPTPEPTEAPAAGQPTASTAKLRGSARDAPDPLATAVARDSGLEAVARSIASNPGPVYTWQDGEHTRRVRLVPGLVVQRSAMNRADDVVLADDGVRSLVQRQDRHGAAAEPVFLAESGGGLMTLPGGALLALDPAWDEARINRFFSDNNIDRSRVTKQEFADNAFLVETAPGLPSLQLANALAVQAGVLISSPNWRQGSALR